MKKRSSILKKLIVGYFSIIIIVVSFTTVFTVNLIKKNHIDYLIKSLKYSNFLIEKNINDTAFLSSSLDISKYLVDNELRITIIKADGKVIADSQNDILKMDNHLNRDEIIKTSFETNAYAIRYSKTTKKDMIYVASSVVRDNSIIGYIRTSTYVSVVDKFLLSLYQNIAIITIVFCLIGLIASFIISKSFTTRILRIIAHVNRLEKKDFSFLIEAEQNDELDSLVQALNKISSQFDYSFKAIEFEKMSFAKTISVMKEGVVVYNLKGEIITSNLAFDNIASQNLLQINGEFYKFFKSILKEHSYKKGNLVFNDNHYTISGVYYSIDNEERVVIVFNDITTLKQLEQMKTDFVANVAHELKTPLTSIYGFTETLEAEVSQENLYFLSIIKRNTKRVINIVSDLISLAYIEDVENSKREIKFEEVNLYEFIKNINELFINKAQEKSVCISFDCNENTTISADAFLLEHVFINLISNAIKYNKKGGNLNIKVSQQPDADFTTIIFEDNGIGISQENIDRVFERFFVTDKSRSKSTGGTGLGLSIVKHSIKLHKGEISLKSSLGEGSTFTVKLPNNLK